MTNQDAPSDEEAPPLKPSSEETTVVAPTRSSNGAGSSSTNIPKKGGDEERGMFTLDGQELSAHLLTLPSVEKPTFVSEPKLLRNLAVTRIALRVTILFATGISLGVSGNVLHSLRPSDHWDLDPSILDESPILRLLCCSVFILAVEFIFTLASAMSSAVRKAEARSMSFFLAGVALLLTGLSGGFGGNALMELLERPEGTALLLCDLKHKGPVSALEKPDYPFLCGEIKTSVAALLIVSILELSISATIAVNIIVRGKHRWWRG